MLKFKKPRKLLEYFLFPRFFQPNFAIEIMDQVTKILHKSRELFFKVGIKSVTMDDIARLLGMSKKTLYQFVDNKADLVNKVMIQHIEEETAFVGVLKNDDLNAIDVIVEIVKHVVQTMRNVPQSALYDLQKYYPKSWNIFNEFKNELIFSTMRDIIIKGKK